MEAKRAARHNLLSLKLFSVIDYHHLYSEARETRVAVTQGRLLGRDYLQATTKAKLQLHARFQASC